MRGGTRERQVQQSQAVQLHVPSGQIWQPEELLLERLSEILTVTVLCTYIATAVGAKSSTPISVHTYFTLSLV